MISGSELETGVDAMNGLSKCSQGIYTTAKIHFKPEEARSVETKPFSTQANVPNARHPLGCPDGTRMQKLMQTYEMRERPRYRLRIVTNLVGIKASLPRVTGSTQSALISAHRVASMKVLSHGYSAAAGSAANRPAINI